MTQRWYIVLFLLCVFLYTAPSTLYAAELDELKNRINERTVQIEALESEIQQYQQEIEKTQKEAQTLEGAVKTLDITSKQLATDINATQGRITNTTLTIEKLELEIGDKERRVEQNQEAIAEAIRRLHKAESNSLIELLLSNQKLSDFWNDIDTVQQFQQSLRGDMQVLLGVKQALAQDVEEREGKREELTDYKVQLQDKRQIVEINKSEKNQLLGDTRNKESEYQRILDEKLRQKEEFERELQEFEAQLKIAIDPSLLPEPGAVFRWPLDIPIRITQLFGNTYFAKQNPSVYGTRGYHPGIDIGAPVGTAVRAPLSGTVWMTGNTDSVSGCYSWGKWILIRHFNGLTTLYAHLSLIKVTTGDQIPTGDIIGYSGKTGYATGPHLHFTVYATKGVQIVPFESLRATTRCKGLVTPAAPLNAYLDPLTYLPKDYTLDD